MYTSTVAFALTSLLALASAQQTYVIAPDTVSNSTRDQWCTQQQSSCPLICLQTTTGVPLSNDCTASTLTYACVCSDGLSPNLTQYSQTLPFFICQEWGNQCASNCGSDNGCVSDCRSNHPCGAQSPVMVNASTASATASATSGGNGGSGNGGTLGGQTVHTGFAGQGDASTSGQNVGGGPGNGAVGSGVGLAVLIGGLALGFAVVL